MLCKGYLHIITYCSWKVEKGTRPILYLALRSCINVKYSKSLAQKYSGFFAKTPQDVGMLITRLYKLVTFIVILLFLYSCADRKPSHLEVIDDKNLARADPGQAQWLEKQSMFYASGELAKVVSGSNISWLASPVAGTHQALFDHASVWLLVDPTALVSNGEQGAFSTLRSTAFWQAMQANNIRGLYLAPTMTSGSVWSGSYYIMDDMDDPVSFGFSDAAGSEKEYFSLLQTANAHQAILGSHIIPSATGIGPDFFLAARNLRQYPGLYCIVEVPENMWDKLPEAKSEWDVKALQAEQVNALSSAGLFPAQFEQESMHLPGGWAATGEVRGLDGQLRRFTYRYYGSPRRAVLNFNDPSAAARRVISGSIVRGIGELGLAFAGTSFLPLTGLSPYDPSLQGKAALEPGLGAASDVGQEIRRYGGWSWNRDSLPISMLKEYMEQRIDFTRDSILSPGAEHALITGNATLLRASLDQMKTLNLDASRLVHSLPGHGGVNYNTDLPGARDAYTELLKYPGVSNLLKSGYLLASGAGIAAIAAGHSANDDLSEQEKANIQKGHQALAFFMAAQPGLFMVPAHDATGALPPGWLAKETFSNNVDDEKSLPSGVAILGEKRKSLMSSKGIMALPSLYPGIDVQSFDPKSFFVYLGKLSTLRDETGVAGGKYLGRVLASGKGVVILATELPNDQGILLAATNFSQKPSSETIRFSAIPGQDEGKAIPRGKIIDAITGQSLGASEGSISISLNGWGTKAIWLQGKGAKAKAVQANKPAERAERAEREERGEQAEEAASRDGEEVVNAAEAGQATEQFGEQSMDKNTGENTGEEAGEQATEQANENTGPSYLPESLTMPAYNPATKPEEKNEQTQANNPAEPKESGEKAKQENSADQTAPKQSKEKSKEKSKTKQKNKSTNPETNTPKEQPKSSTENPDKPDKPDKSDKAGNSNTTPSEQEKAAPGTPLEEINKIMKGIS